LQEKAPTVVNSKIDSALVTVITCPGDVLEFMRIRARCFLVDVAVRRSRHVEESGGARGDGRPDTVALIDVPPKFAQGF